MMTMGHREAATDELGHPVPPWDVGVSHPVWRWVLLIGLLLIFSVLHFATSPHQMWIHEFLFKVTYLPIVLAGLWFGLRGGSLLAVLTGGIYIVHIRWQLAGAHGRGETGMILELVLYLLIGLVVGWLSDRQRGVQKRLSVANAQLQQSLGSLREKTEALLHAEESLRHADRLRAAGEIAAGLAHEVRNPLGGIMGAAEILTRPDTAPADRREFASVLTREAKRLDRVITQFLDFSRPGVSGGAGVCNLYEELQFVEKLTAGPRSKKQVGFGLEGVSPKLKVGMSADALRQVLLNLTLNALAAVPNETGRIVWRARRQGNAVSVSITDNGHGVSGRVRDRLFEPFVTTRDGTGLGLAIVARLMNDVGGKVALERSDRSGTVFVLSFPSVSEGPSSSEDDSDET